MHHAVPRLSPGPENEKVQREREEVSIDSGETLDVVVLGGGLAGLTLGLQLKRTRPQTSVLVAEKRAGPPPEAAFKVGESTAEVAAHYFGTVLGLQDHLDNDQYHKAGLRFFFTANGNEDIARRPEFGPTRVSPTPTYQVDRGVLEAELAERCRAAGVDLRDGTRVEDVELGKPHTITLSHDGETRTVTATWVVDAAGRAAILKQKLGLDRPVVHNINAAWFRLEGGLDFEEWSDDPDWLGRMPERGLRKRSTTHMVGKGYWVWLIQLQSGPISIGICADPRIHPFEQINTFDAFMHWAHRYEPQLADALETRRDGVLDFLKVERFPLGAERVYSMDRWCLTGEAGVFTDAFYSPGSDFIGIGNSFISDIVTRDLDGEDVAERLEFFNSVLFALFERYLALYTDMYLLMGNAQAMGIKHSVDVCAYWGEIALPFMKANFADMDLLKAILPPIRSTTELLARTMAFYREWDAIEQREVPPLIIPRPGKSSVGNLLFTLARDVDPATVRPSVEENAKRFQAFVVLVFDRVVSQVLPDARPDENTRINPFAISLDPDRWEADGLFGTDEHPGISVADAKTQFEGFDLIWLGEVEAAETTPGPDGRMLPGRS